MDQPASDARGQFGRYRILAPLGQTGVGHSYRAVDTSNDQTVALTVLPPSAQRDRFNQELRIVAGLTEPHLIPLQDWGQLDGVCYLVTRMVPGETLRSLVATFGPIDAERAVAIIEQVAAAVDAAHRARLMHRDIRPDNVLVGDDGAAYLLGLGISDPALGASGPTLESHAYLAPERFRDQPLTSRADVYSLTCVLAEILTGERPFPNATTVSQLIQAHLTEPPPKPSVLRPHVISPRFDAVIARGMAKNPGQRYATAGDLARAARDAIPTFGDAPTGIRQISVPGSVAAADKASDAALIPAWYGVPAWQNPKLLAVAAAVLLLVVGLIGWRVLTPDRSVSPSGSSTSAPSTYQKEVLPFSGLTGPEGVAVDSSGAVYVSNIDNDRVLKLAAGSTTQDALPFTGLKEPYGLAVAADGGVYVADTDNNRVLKLAAGAAAQTVLAFGGLNRPQGLAVDASGTVFVVDTGNDRVVKLAAGATKQTVLSFAGLERPKGVAVAADGSVYVADTGNNRVLKLAAGADTETVLAFTGLKDPSGLAADASGGVYVTDGSRVLRLAAGDTKQTVLPDQGLGNAKGVAVDSSGNVYVTDYGNDQVVKLAAG